VDERPEAGRIQIGFGMLDWTLTDASSPSDQRPIDVLMNHGSVDQDRAMKYWKPWTVYAAGTSLIVLYLSGFSLWTAAFGIFARHEVQAAGP
jgi:hypothetical protein